VADVAVEVREPPRRERFREELAPPAGPEPGEEHAGIVPPGGPKTVSPQMNADQIKDRFEINSSVFV
jgi:hypothetical protein